MKNLFYFLLLFVFGCEVYEEPSNPQLNLNGRWDVVDIRVFAQDMYSEPPRFNRINVTNDDIASVGSFNMVGSTEDGFLILTQDFENTSLNRRFDVNNTIWEFDYYDLIVRDSLDVKSFPIDFRCQSCTKQTKLNFLTGSETNYTFSIDTYGAMPSNELILTSQVFYTDIFTSNGQFDKAVRAKLEIILHRY